MQHLIYVTDTVLALFISRSRARCNQLGYGLRVGDAFFSFPAHGRDATTPTTTAQPRRKDFHFPLTGEMQLLAAGCISRTSGFHFPLTGEMQLYRRAPYQGIVVFISRSRARCNGATFLPSNSACQEVHLREPAFAIFWNIDFSFRNRMFDVGSRQIA